MPIGLLSLTVLLGGCAHYDHFVTFRVRGELEPEVLQEVEEISLHYRDYNLDDVVTERERHIGVITSPTFDITFLHGWGRSQFLFLGGYVGRATVGVQLKADERVLVERYWQMREVPRGADDELILDLGVITMDPDALR